MSWRLSQIHDEFLEHPLETVRGVGTVDHWVSTILRKHQFMMLPQNRELEDATAYAVAQAVEILNSGNRSD